MKLIYFTIPLLLLINTAFAQGGNGNPDCISAPISGVKSAMSLNADGNCEVRLCVFAEPNPQAKRIQFKISNPDIPGIAMCYSGGQISWVAPNTDCGSGADKIPSGTYCYTFTLTGACPADVDAAVYGYTDASGGTGGGGGGGECQTVLYPNIPLPIKLASFDAVRVSDGVVLSWATSEEFQNKAFELQRSTDAIGFQTIATIAGAGTSTETNYYTYTDTQSKSGNVYYRLRYTDVAGHVEYSSMVAIAKEEQGGGLSVYPNPVKNRQFVIKDVQASQLTSCYLTDLKGNQIAVQYSSTAEGLEVQVAKGQLASGVYFLQLHTADKKISQKLLID